MEMRNGKDIEIKAMKVKGNIHKNGITRIIKGVIEKSNRKSITIKKKKKIKEIIKNLSRKFNNN